MSATHIDPDAVRSLAATFGRGTADLTGTAAAVRALPGLSSTTPAGAAWTEFCSGCGRAAAILADASEQMGDRMQQAAHLWRFLDTAVIAHGRRAAGVPSAE